MRALGFDMALFDEARREVAARRRRLANDEGEAVLPDPDDDGPDGEADPDRSESRPSPAGVSATFKKLGYRAARGRRRGRRPPAPTTPRRRMTPTTTCHTRPAKFGKKT